MTELLQKAIEKKGGLSVAKPAAVLDEMEKSGVEQGLPTYTQVAHKLEKLRNKENIRPPPKWWPGALAASAQSAAMGPTPSDKSGVTAIERGIAASQATHDYLLDRGGDAEGAREAASAAAARAEEAAWEEA